MCSAFSEEDDVRAEESSDAFDADSDFAASSTRSRKRSSMCERESFSELPGLPEDLSKCPHGIISPGFCISDVVAVQCWTVLTKRGKRRNRTTPMHLAMPAQRDLLTAAVVWHDQSIHSRGTEMHPPVHTEITAT